MHTINGLVARASSLAVTWDDDEESIYPWLWLRENAHEPETLHPVTRQRQLFTAGLPAGLSATGVAVVGDDLVVRWDGGGKSSLPVRFLAEFRSTGPFVDVVRRSAVSWDRTSIEASWPTMPFADVMADDGAVGEWLGLVARSGFCLVTGVPCTIDATESLLRRVGYVRETIFGGMWDFAADLAKADTAYTDLELLPHTDGTYSHDAPGLQLLHCLAFDGSGGESTMVDGLRIAEVLRETAPGHHHTLSSVEVPGQYIGDGVHLMAARPVFRHDSSGRLAQVSFNNYDRAPFLRPDDEMTAFYDALRAFEALANDRDLQWRRALAPGDAVLFDNWRVLHGRASFTGHRHMAGGYVNREDYESKLRTLASSEPPT